jgi:hypothetical protein
MDFERRNLDNQRKVQRKDTWHLDKNISISHMFATISIVVGLFLWASKMDTRITVVETTLITNKAAFLSNDEQIRQEASNKEHAIAGQLADIKVALARIEAALGNKADKDLVQALVTQLKKEH